MQLNAATYAPVVPKPQPLVTPTVQAAIAPVAAAQQTAPQTRTQTLQAPQAAGRSENGREAQTGTGTGRSLDTQAGAVNARTNGTGYGLPRRGMRLDVSV